MDRNESKKGEKGAKKTANAPIALALAAAGFGFITEVYYHSVKYKLDLSEAYGVTRRVLNAMGSRLCPILLGAAVLALIAATVILNRKRARCAFKCFGVACVAAACVSVIAGLICKCVLGALPSAIGTQLLSVAFSYRLALLAAAFLLTVFACAFFGVFLLIDAGRREKR
ncbi:MAG: hypothetical protein IKS90_05130 [Clostridia bacterium]|nr:hypothetical protein [Clostridia bacterium]